MVVNLAIPVIAGCAAALMFASIASGKSIALLLLYLSPLPLIVAGLGWGSMTGLLASLVATVSIGFAATPYSALLFAMGIAAPAWWLSRLTLLAQPIQTEGTAPSAAPGALEWYPTGRLLLWIAAYAVVITSISLFTLGADETAIRAALRANFESILGMLDSADKAKVDLDRWTEIAPASMTVGTIVLLTINFWAGAKLVAISGRLLRPWPDLRFVMLPKLTLAVTACAVVLSFVGGLIGLLAQIAAAALLFCYVFVGLGVLHVMTLRLPSRGFWLSVAYVSIPVTYFWSLLLVIALGITDAVAGLRARFTPRPPPLPSPPHS